MIRSAFQFLVLCSILVVACNDPAGKGSGAGTTGNDSTKIIKQYHPNKKLKAEISVKDTVRHGITRTYSLSGTLFSEVMYLNGKRNGKAVNYYPDGKVNSVIYYKDNMKTGESVWYYPSGKTYRVTPYLNGEPDGVQKIFYESGKLQAEIPYTKGKKCPGLKEYLENGKLRMVPEILLEADDRVALSGIFTLRISLSNQSRTVKYYTGLKNNGPCLSGYETSIPSRAGVGVYELPVLRGQTVMEKLDIIAVETTSFGNERVLHKSYNLALRNR
ncbi:MAG: toxin-antitoxin system YwqK family antitoxin [Bacteroidales bacterium]